MRPFARSQDQQIAAWPRAAKWEGVKGADDSITKRSLRTLSKDEETLVSKLSNSPDKEPGNQTTFIDMWGDEWPSNDDLSS